MAIGFFRRRKKLMVGILVLLMISMGAAGVIQWIFGSGSGKDRDIYTSLNGEITAQDLEVASNDIGLLDLMGVGNKNTLSRVQSNAVSQNFFAFMVLVKQPGNKGSEKILYAALVKEAAKSQMQITSGDIEFFVQVLGGKDTYADSVNMLRSRTGRTEKQMNAVVARWLGVVRTMQFAIPGLPISNVQAQRAYRDHFEKIKMRIVKVPASNYLKDISLPSDTQIDELFNKYKSSATNQYSDAESFGIGYRQPRRVRLHYLLLNRNAISYASKPFAREVEQRYKQNKSSYTKEVSKEVKNPGDDAGDDKSDTDVKETVQMKFSEASDKIAREISDERLKKYMDELENNISSKLDRYKDRTAGENDSAINAHAYDRLVDEITKDASDMLAMKLDISIVREKASDAIDLLGEAAGVRICYPFDSASSAYSAVKIDGDVIVNLTKADCATLGSALSALAKALNVPAMEWMRCTGFSAKAIFPVYNKSMRPVIRFDAGEISAKEMSWHAILGRCETPDREKLADIAVLVGHDGPSIQNIPPLYMDGVVMEAGFMGNKGRVIWRVTKVIADHTPESNSPSKDVRSGVIDDWKMLQAFALAKKDVADIKNVSGLEKFIEKNKPSNQGEISKLTDITSEMFSRSSGIQELAQLGVATVMQNRRYLPVQAVNEFATKQAFTLAPKYPDKPYNVEGEAVLMIPLPSAKAVILVQRVDYTPAVQADFDKMRVGIIKSSIGERWEGLAMSWMSKTNIETRTGLKRAVDQE